MLLIIALLLIVIFGGLGFAVHILWIGLIIGAALLVVNSVAGRGRGL